MFDEVAVLCGQRNHDFVYIDLAQGVRANLWSYRDAYKDLGEDWWGMALMGQESRFNFLRYIGKRNVSDSFIADIDKKLKKELPELRIFAVCMENTAVESIATDVMFDCTKKIDVCNNEAFFEVFWHGNTEKGPEKKYESRKPIG